MMDMMNMMYVLCMLSVMMMMNTVYSHFFLLNYNWCSNNLSNWSDCYNWCGNFFFNDSFFFLNDSFFFLNDSFFFLNDSWCWLSTSSDKHNSTITWVCLDNSLFNIRNRTQNFTNPRNCSINSWLNLLISIQFILNNSELWSSRSKFLETIGHKFLPQSIGVFREIQEQP